MVSGHEQPDWQEIDGEILPPASEPARTWHHKAREQELREMHGDIASGPPAESKQTYWGPDQQEKKVGRTGLRAAREQLGDS